MKKPIKIEVLPAGVVPRIAGPSNKGPGPTKVIPSPAGWKWLADEDFQQRQNKWGVANFERPDHYLHFRGTSIPEGKANIKHLPLLK